MLPVNCFGCGRALTPVFADLPDGSWQGNNALIVAVEGGYGMFCDPMGPTSGEDRSTGVIIAEEKVIVCHDCAHMACAKVSWLGRLIDPLNSHSHRHDQDNSGHQGWDLPHRCVCGNELVFEAQAGREICPDCPSGTP